MKKKANKPETTEASYYDLHTGAVDDLVNATRENTPRYSEEELNKYRSGKSKWKFPQWLKVGLIKFWFYGAVCYFVFWGLGLYVADQLDLMFAGAIVMGMVTDLLINHFLRFTEKLPGGSKKWMMVTKRGATGFFLNLLYGFALLFLVITAYNVLNMFMALLFGENVLVLGVEPVFFGLACMGTDMLCIAFKRMLLKIVSDAKRS